MTEAREIGIDVRIKVRFADVDHAQVVYYPRFFHYFHVAFEELLEQRFGKTYPQVLDEDGLGFPAVNVSAQYRRPVRFGDILLVHATCARVGNKSVTMRYRARRERDNVECAVGEVTTACVDMTRFESIPLPPRFRAFFESLVAAEPSE